MTASHDSNDTMEIISDMIIDIALNVVSNVMTLWGISWLEFI